MKGLWPGGRRVLGAVGALVAVMAVAPVARASSVTSPASYTVNQPLHITSGGADYWVDVPASYDSTHHTPITLFIWMHGCEGAAQYAIADVTPGASRSYIAISVGGRDYVPGVNDGCWDPNVDVPKVLAALADVETHFNIELRRVIIGGYSSGGDLAYRTIFYNANLFAGLLTENTSPFRDTGSSAAQSLAAASWKFNVVHLAHVQDTTYPLDGVTNEINTMKSAGFPVTFLTQPGDHYDDPGQNGYAGTVPDLQTYVLPHISDGWLAPGSPAQRPAPPPRPCAGLKGAKLKRCRARQTYKNGLAACNRKYSGKGKHATARRNACRKRVTAQYRRALARVKCDAIKNASKHRKCIAKANKAAVARRR